MTPEELAALLETLIKKADDSYAAVISRIQNQLYREMVAILKDLEVNAQGSIKQTAANRKVLNSAIQEVKRTFTSDEYIATVARAVAAVPKIDSATEKYYSTISDTFKASKQFLKALREQTVVTVEQYILQDGLQAQVVSPLAQIMTQNVNTGGNFADFLEQLKTYIKGNEEVEGRAMSYTRTFLKDTLFTYARSLHSAITNDLGLEFYLYSGGNIDTTRQFCLDRSGQYFHQKEIEKWAELEWNGKKQGTTPSSIFLFAGGWNCGHQIIPVSVIIVPDLVINRAIEAGYYKKSSG